MQPSSTPQPPFSTLLTAHRHAFMKLRHQAEQRSKSNALEIRKLVKKIAKQDAELVQEHLKNLQCDITESTTAESTVWQTQPTPKEPRAAEPFDE